MSFDFITNIRSAIQRCNCELVAADNNCEVYKIYPFTTENISGYINNFNLIDK